MTSQPLERQILELVATDRLHIPVSSMSGKLKRMEPKIAKTIDLSGYNGNFQGERVYARVETSDTTEKARAMTEAINQFVEEYPRHGKILKGLIEETRAAKETHLYFGMNEGCRLTADDYRGVMTSLGFTEAAGQALYPVLMDTSRTISRKRQEERSILIG